MQGTTLACMRDSNFRKMLHQGSEGERNDERYKQRMLESRVLSIPNIPQELEDGSFAPIRGEHAFDLAGLGCDHQQFLPHSLREAYAAR